MNINDATQKWVSEFNAFPHSMIKTLWDDHADDWTEITPPAINDKIYVYETGKEGEITKIKDSNDETLYSIKLNNGKTIRLKSYELRVTKNSILPMWGTMWSFNSIFDKEWIEKERNQKAMANCGFRIYHHEEWGYFFGIDGAGYDFYEAHWIPLYKARGLQWHNKTL